MNINDAFDLISTYLSVLRVEHFILVKLALDVAKGRVDCSRLIRVMGSHVEKEEKIMLKHNLGADLTRQLRDKYLTYYDLCIKGKLGRQELMDLIKVIKDHDEDLTLIINKLIAEYLSAVLNEFNSIS